MKNSTIVMPHQVNQVTPMLAAEARVSMVRIAETENSSRSARPRTRSKWGLGAGDACAGPVVMRGA